MAGFAGFVKVFQRVVEALQRTPTNAKAKEPVIESTPPTPAKKLKIVRLGEPGAFDITSARKFGRRTAKPRILVLHWGMHDAHGLYKYFLNVKDRDVSSHWAVDETGAYEMLSTDKSAWHAGWINRHSIGLDICQQPTVKDRTRYLEMGRQIAVQNNDTNRGDRQVLSLDPRIAENFRTLVLQLCEEHGIPLNVPRDASGKVRHDVVFPNESALGNWSGVLGHHHVSASKWDIACWWDQIFKGTPLG